MRMLQTILAWVILWTPFLASLGCSRSDRAAVSGQVTLDGSSVENGVISFIPADGNSSRAAWAEIKSGRYAIPAKLGAGIGINRVEVSWPRKTGKMRPALPPAPPVEEAVEAIPPRYNCRSELRVEIKPGSNQADFQLKSK